ncbi:putative signal peptide protein [Puccinia sorghi]|uniref:Putative signal peptide protein n=1 Tax=Puccinia sorghi TaxID=27349 RepID=A0A0L6UTC0_9BASI|nr:putative signal peptide protein [Puccinia sorghi]
MKLILLALISCATTLRVLGKSVTFVCSDVAPMDKDKVVGWCGTRVHNDDPRAEVNFNVKLSLANRGNEKGKAGFNCNGKNADNNFCCKTTVNTKKSPQILSPDDALSVLCIVKPGI